MTKSLFRISVSLAVLGMAFGIFMGIKQDFALACRRMRTSICSAS